MYQVPNAGPPRRSWQWWLITSWIILLAIGYLGGIGLVVSDGTHSRGAQERLIVSCLVGGALLWMARRRGQQAVHAEEATPPRPIPAGGDRYFWASLVSATVWAGIVVFRLN
ncbi:MAG TPA: hypothetical protein VGE07_22930 [Herpetosiphonaceae bacterium]